jgi:hypothetical protein
MAEKWSESGVVDGVGTIRLKSWQYFNDLMHDLGHAGLYIWRGQRSETWKLSPTLDRLLSTYDDPDEQYRIRQSHLTQFKFAARGRRGTNPSAIDLENDWWALGQHNFLASPLLDWTTSPYTAAFFAFATVSPDQSPKRAVYALCREGVKERSDEIRANHDLPTRPPVVELVQPLSDDNARLVNQAGLFTRAPDGEDIETWVKREFQGDNETYHLMKVTFPDNERHDVLRSLNRMNINYLSLFPDMYGASMHCNMAIEIEDY